MKTISRSRRLPLALAGAVVLPAVAFLPWLGGDAEGVPTATVERRDFVRRVWAEGHLRAVRSTPLAVPREAGGPVRIAWQVADGSRVTAGDVVVRFDPSEMEERLITARDELATADLRMEQTRLESAAQLANLARDAELAELQLENARKFQKQDGDIYSRHDIIESEIDQELAREKKRHADGARRTRRALAAAETELLAIERRQASLEIDEAETGLSALEVVAPHDGIVVFRRDWRGNMPRVGDTVWPGHTLAEIPRLDALEAEVYVLEADAGGLAAGQTALVRLLSHPGNDRPARVRRIESLARPRVRGSPVQYFALTLELAATDPGRMKPGARVEAVLVPAERREALVIPRQAVFERDGESVVYRRAGRRSSRFEPVAVELGPVGMGRAVVTAGLAEGDVIALADPTRPAAAPAENGGEAAPATLGAGLLRP